MKDREHPPLSEHKFVSLKFQRRKCNLRKWRGSIANVTHILKFTQIIFIGFPIVLTISHLIFMSFASAYHSLLHLSLKSIILHAIMRQFKIICPWGSLPERHFPQITTSGSFSSFILQPNYHLSKACHST